eukprot:266215_1
MAQYYAKMVVTDDSFIILFGNADDSIWGMFSGWIQWRHNWWNDPTDASVTLVYDANLGLFFNTTTFYDRYRESGYTMIGNVIIRSGGIPEERNHSLMVNYTEFRMIDFGDIVTDILFDS